jgi:NADH-quinone oxidoreductase subunit G
MPKLTINGVEIEVPFGITVMQACQLQGIEIPHFCYHDRLAIAGNCRMCLVEMEKSPKPVASCAMPVADGMVIRTDSEQVKKDRAGVMEFLLINHPLDCPICDQGGECDLQDEAMAFGFDRSRYREAKRAVTDKNMGPLVKTIMTRCIHCTRCVRFATEVAGMSDLGALNRGEKMEIATYVEQAVNTELSGNIVDLCPVGALTSKPYAFKARPWELKKTESIDVLDAVGSNIRIDSKGAEVMRILPRLHEDVNEEWIADKTRHACDGLKRQRLDRPYVRKNGRLVEASWDEAFAAIARSLDGLKGDEIAVLAGAMVDAETMFLAKKLFGERLRSPYLDCRTDGAKLLPGVRASYLFNSGIAGIEQADALLLVGTNPRWEAPMINARMRKAYLRSGMGSFPIGVIGVAPQLNYPYQHMGRSPLGLQDVLSGQHPFVEQLKAAQRPALILGGGAINRPDGAAILHTAYAVADKYAFVRDGWNGFNLLHTAASRVAGLDLGFVPQDAKIGVGEIMAEAAAGKIKLLYLMGVDDLLAEDLSKLRNSSFVVYQGHHGDAGAAAADVVLPGAAYTEKTGWYKNTEGRLQSTQQAILPPGEAREDWKILRALSERIGQTLPYNDLAEVRLALAKAFDPLFSQLDTAQPTPWQSFGQPGRLIDTPMVPVINNYYMTDVISRNSETMAKCTEAFVLGKKATA